MSRPEKWVPAFDVPPHEGMPSSSRPWIVTRVLSRRQDNCPSMSEELQTKYGGIRSFETKEEAQAAADLANEKRCRA